MKARPCWCPKPVLWELNSFVMQTLSFVPINGHVSENTLFTTFSSPELLGFISSKRNEGLSKGEWKKIRDDPCSQKSEYRLGLQTKRLGKSSKVKHSECVFLDLHGQVRIIKNMFGTGSNIHLYLPWKRFRVAENSREHSPGSKQNMISWRTLNNANKHRHHEKAFGIVNNLQPSGFESGPAIF